VTQLISHRGFTLLEMIIALAVVSLSLVGAASVIRSSVSSSGHLETKTQAYWVAQNEAASLALSDHDLDESVIKSSETVMGRRYLTETILRPVDDSLIAAEITVSTDSMVIVSHSTLLIRH